MAFSGKVVLVTGASAGIGKAIAIRFSKESAKLVIVGRTEEALKEVAELCTKNSGHKAIYIIADVSKSADIERIFETTKKGHGKLDILVNNAGVFITDNLFTATLDNFDTHMNTHVRAVFDLVRLFSPLLIESKGNIVNISGVETFKYLDDAYTESVSKAAMEHLAKHIAYELALKKVRVNTLVLGYVTGTKIITRFGIDPVEFTKEYLKTVPLGEPIYPEEVAEVVAFVASDKAKHITGQKIVMDGGSILH